MAHIYGYARCSTNEARQDINRQKRELRKLGVENDRDIYWEYESGTKTDRAELMKLMEIVAPGDTIVTTEVSRLTRSTRHLCDIMNAVQRKKVRLVIGSFTVDCRAEETDPMTKGMLLMWGVFAEMERDIISQRVKSGVANARAKGKRLGRPPLAASDFPRKFWDHLPLYKEKKISLTGFAKIMGCSRPTLYRYLGTLKPLCDGKGQAPVAAAGVPGGNG